MNILTIWRDDAGDGPTNMAVDECLAAEAERLGGLLLRLYSWSEPTVSLGSFQRIDEARRVEAIRGIPLVRRPSGGGAIVHGSDLTYAAAVPKTHPWGASPQTFYDAIHDAMVKALAAHGIPARRYVAGMPPPADGQAVQGWPDAPSHASGHGEPPFFCFDRRAAGDLILTGSAERGACKIMGSAQRRFAGVVLQHGSLLLRGNPDVAGPARHPGVADILPECSMPDEASLSSSWCRWIADALDATIRDEGSPFLRGRESHVQTLATRFRGKRWTVRR